MLSLHGVAVIQIFMEKRKPSRFLGRVSCLAHGYLSVGEGIAVEVLDLSQAVVLVQTLCEVFTVWYWTTGRSVNCVPAAVLRLILIGASEWDIILLVSV